jgi:NAD(P)-dependent dehydrogenase (short-subunit alcohol dehydrogenase family)
MGQWNSVYCHPFPRIGQAIALRISRNGHLIIAVDINDPTATVEKITTKGGQATSYACDLRENAAVTDLFERIDEQSYSQTALKRLGKPEEIAEVVCFAASAAASYMIGSVIMADDGVLAS